MERLHGWGFRRLVAGACALLVAVSLGGCSLLTPSRADVPPEETLTKLTTPAIATKGVLTVGIVADDAPQVTTDEDGQLQGYTIDVARALAKNLGLDVTFVTSSDPSSVGSSGEPDIYLGATADDATDDVAVSGDFLEDAPALFARTSDGAAAGLLTTDDLAGKTVAVQMGSSTQDLLTKAGISAEQKTYSNVNECLMALENGEVDYAACDATAGAYIARAYSDVSFAGTFDTATTYGIAVRTINTDLTDAVTEALNDLVNDGTLDAIHTAWYGDLPSSLSDVLVSGVTTSEDREAATKEQEEAAADKAEESADEEDAAGTAADATADTSTESA